MFKKVLQTDRQTDLWNYVTEFFLSCKVFDHFHKDLNNILLYGYLNMQ